jgi:UDP-N-acetylmuramoyl-L-alanyl-D-glutamate--2,6-diaminopimelate ligase
MHLSQIQRALAEENLLVDRVDPDPALTAVTDDSRRVEPGALFCAVRGTADDGHRFLADAAQRGAVAALVTRRSDVPLPQVAVVDGRRAAGIAAREWFGNPGKRMSLVGVTGTNGKTTTVAITWHLLNSNGRTGRIGTLGAFDGADQRLTGYASLTTPGPVEFHSVLADLLSRGVSTVVMEASSHGLDQGRLEGAAFKAAVYTNLTHEHLDYHASLEAYAEAKMKLSELLTPDGVEIVNAEDPVWESLPARAGIRKVIYGRGALADVQCGSERLNPDGSECRFVFGGSEHAVRVPLLGEFNVTNALAAAATAWSSGEDPAVIADRLATVPKVPGRMELLNAGEFTVLRDYAHTPDGFQRAIATIKAITPGRLIVLFGVGGDRDRAKRPLMGRIAAEGADLVVLTEDNPRTEDPDATIDDIEAGMGNAEHLRIRDRELGIRTAVALMEQGDCLLLLGKGHETYQIIGTEKLPFDERAIVESAVAELT